MKVSDELRQWCDICSGDFIGNDDCDELRGLADRIDSEMIELPKTADGVPIHIWDTAYTEDGDGFEIVRIIFELGTTKITCSTGGDVGVMRIPSCVFHERPDSWERIAAELEEWSEDNRVNGNGEVFDRASIFADRIRKLAKREASDE